MTTARHVHRAAARAAALPARSVPEAAMSMTTATRSCTPAGVPGSVADLLPAVSDGDPAALEEAVRRYGKLVSAAVRSFRLQDADALDAVQMTWLRLAENADRVLRSERLGGWLAATARHECLHILRQAKPSPDPLETVADTVADPGLGPEQRAIDGDAARTLWNLVEELPARQRTLLRALFTDHPRPYAELAHTTGIPPGAIGPTRARALQHLREKLTNTGDGQHGNGSPRTFVTHRCTARFDSSTTSSSRRPTTQA